MSTVTAATLTVTLMLVPTRRVPSWSAPVRAALRELEQMINATDADVAVVATPVDLARLITIRKPAVRVRYELVEAEGSPAVAETLKPIRARAAAGRRRSRAGR